MSNGSARELAAKEQLSALADGELESSATAAACAAWKEDPQMRATWHSYQLIGDVLRSEDLARPSASDRAFMSELRLRLAAEPVVLAPQPAAESARGAVRGRSRTRWGWGASSAVAAGVVAVSGALLVTRTPSPNAPAVASAVAPQAVADAASLSTSPRTQSVAMSLPPRGAYLRDPQLDRYLAAHRQFAGSAMLGMPSSGYLRNANVDVPGR